MRTGFGLLVAGALVAAVAGPSRAADQPAAPGTAPTTQAKPKKQRAHTKRVSGKVVSSTATSIVIKLGKKAGGTEQTFTVPDTAKVVDGKDPIKLDAIAAGTRVSVTTTDDGTVTRVRVNHPKPAVAPATQPDKK
ncbi:MAG: hypothetical protein JOZ57_14185 [Abitibacteriaceae bacterium]|nr:hypothetical protein [Abditibacteriaceae bacterium]